MLLLISDANVLIDVEIGELVTPMFNLNYQFAVPDVLYFEELEEQHATLLNKGLQIHTLPETGVKRVQILSQKYTKPGRNDLFGLVLAEVTNSPLLTGDLALRKAAEAEKIEVKGTIWLMKEMLLQQCASVTVIREAIDKMKLHGRRLPWDSAENILSDFE